MHSHTERISHGFSKFFATSGAFYCGVAIAILWIVSWFADRRWHELLVESVTILSFLTIFTFQRSQSKDIKAMQIKLDELIASSDVASNRLIKAEEAPEHVLNQVHEIYKDVAKAAMEEDPRTRLIDISHAESIIEAFHNQTAEEASASAPLPVSNA
jgi:low affinity Fe/Cu permease